MIVLSIILTAVIVSSIFIIRNLIKKNEVLEDFIAKQSDAIEACDKRLQEIDDKGIFYADDQIGFFFKEVQKIQEALNEFMLK
jgi:peptidoglycan hydrolase CwlO-like protein|tara:strand:- start:923 stop:1171 length:249 start_codon:yes stop_codon:yes gene_type:complete